MSETQRFALYGGSPENASAVARVLQTGLWIGAVLALIAGVAVLTWPGGTATVVAVIFGLYFLIRGAVRVVVGVFAPGLTGGGRALSILIGVLLTVVGVFALASPSGLLDIIGLLIGVTWIIDGIATVVESGRGSSRGVAFVLGVISIVAGVIVLFVPAAAITVLVVLGGILLIVVGVAQITAAVTLGRLAKRGTL